MRRGRRCALGYCSCCADMQTWAWQWDSPEHNHVFTCTLLLAQCLSCYSARLAIVRWSLSWFLSLNPEYYSHPNDCYPFVVLNVLIILCDSAMLGRIVHSPYCCKYTYFLLYVLRLGWCAACASRNCTTWPQHVCIALTYCTHTHEDFCTVFLTFLGCCEEARIASPRCSHSSARHCSSLKSPSQLCSLCFPFGTSDAFCMYLSLAACKDRPLYLMSKLWTMLAIKVSLSHHVNGFANPPREGHRTFSVAAQGLLFVPRPRAKNAHKVIIHGWWPNSKMQIPDTILVFGYDMPCCVLTGC